MSIIHIDIGVRNVINMLITKSYNYHDAVQKSDTVYQYRNAEKKSRILTKWNVNRKYCLPLISGIYDLDSKFFHLGEVLLREIIFYIVCVGGSDIYSIIISVDMSGIIYCGCIWRVEALNPSTYDMGSCLPPCLSATSPSKYWSHSWKRDESIHAFVLCRYIIGRLY